MKATLEFTLPEEQDEFDKAQQGMSYWLALEEMDGWLRNILKYGALPDEEQRIYQEVRDKLTSIRYE